MISSSRNVVKSKDAKEIRAFVPPDQTMEYRLEEKRKEKAVLDFSREAELEAAAGADADSVSAMEAAEVNEVLERAMEEAQKLRQEAEAIREDAMEQAQIQRQDAEELGYRDGYERGYQEGYEQAIKDYENRCSGEWQQFKQDMEKALVSVEEAKKRSLDTYLDELKDCAIAVGEKVIHISLQSSGAIIKRMIMAETEKLKKTAWVRIYMGKTDYDMMMQGDEDVISELSRLSDHVKFVVMNKEKRGDCIIEMPDEVIDISVDTQMENIRKILENVR